MTKRRTNRPLNIAEQIAVDGKPGFVVLESWAGRTKHPVLEAKKRDG